MITLKNLLVVGASNRNLGKTEFICRLIERFQEFEIVAIKIKSIYPGDKKFHGKDLDPGRDYLLRKEDPEIGLDDSKRFISSGAREVFYIKSNYLNLGRALEEVRSEYHKSQLFIAESNSILGYCYPGGFIMINGPDQSKYKPSSLKFIQRADIIINSNGSKFDIDPEDINIRINDNNWILDKG